MKIHCLSVEVYRSHFGDCTNGGVSSRFNELLIACPDGNETFDSDIETPLNFCMVETLIFRGVEHQHIVPAMIDGDKIAKRPGWWMCGGNIADTPDSRWTAIKGHYYPLKIHDRRE